MIYNITCSTDDNYLQHCMAMLCSVFENNKQHTVHIHLLVDDSLSDVSRKQISELSAKYSNKAYFYDVDPKLVEGFDISDASYNGQKRFPMLVYYRLLLTKFIPQEIETILYLDCDVIVLHDLQDLFMLNMKNYGLAAIKDSSPINSQHRRKMGLGLQHFTFCSGVMLINLDYWRKIDIIKELERFFTLDTSFVCLPDQDALNYVFRDHWLQLPYKWGKTPYTIALIDKNQLSFDIWEYEFAPCIIHYSSSEKPWMDIWIPQKKYYIKYLKLSAYKNVTYQHLPFKLKGYIMQRNCRYVINKYIHPIIPNTVETVLLDIMNFVRLVFSSFYGLTALRSQIQKCWISKYK